LFVAQFSLVVGPQTVIAQGAPPPYDSDNNKLIDQKLAPVFTADSDYVKNGRFYDMGRNPDPMPGYAACEYGDYRFRVTHIKFDLSADVGTGDVTGEGLEVWKTHTLKLEHVNEGRTKGEWIYKWVTSEPDAGRNEPALYACQETCKIMVRIEASSSAPVASAQVGAKQLAMAGGTEWVDVQPKLVSF
jgi:hypothetical protein